MCMNSGTRDAGVASPGLLREVADQVTFLSIQTSSEKGLYDEDT